MSSEVHTSSRFFSRPRPLSVAQLLGGLLAVLAIYYAWQVLLIALAGVLVAVLLQSLAEGISRVTRLSYGWALALTALLIAGLAGAFFYSIGSRLALQAGELVEAVPRGVQRIHDDLVKYEWGEWLLEQLPQSQALGNLPSRVTDMASSILEFLSLLGIVLFLGLYIAIEPDVYVRGLLRLVPLDNRERAGEVLSVLGFNLRWWLLGQVVSMALIGTFIGIGLWIGGVRLAMTLGVLAALLEVVPTFGPIVWLIPAVLVALTQGTTEVINVFVVYAVVQGLESYLVQPLIQRRMVRMPASVSILAIVLFGLLGGVMGLLVATPVALMVMLLIKMLYVEDRLGDKNIKVLGESRSRAAHG